MEGLLVILAVIGFFMSGLWQSAYMAGKREGSRKAYGVGYARGRRAQSGCLVVIAAGLTLAASLCLAAF